MVSSTAAVWLVLLLSLVAANLPFVNERVFVVGPRRASKSLGWRLLEVLVLEALIGRRHPQGWEFYAVLVCLFLTFAFPGFVWRYLRRHRHSVPPP